MVTWIVFMLFIVYAVAFLIGTFGSGMSQLEAGDHGLVCTPQRGASRLLAWEELRLVEVFLEGSVRIYQVYGEKTQHSLARPALICA